MGKGMYTEVGLVARKVKQPFVDAVNERILPNGYTQLSYIESTGTQRIDMGFKPDSNTSIEMRVLIPTSQSGKIVRFFEARDNTNSFGVLSFDDYNKILQFRYPSGKNLSNGQLSVNKVYKIKTDKNKLYVDDVLKITCDTASFQTNYNLILFALNQPSGITSNDSVYRTYDFIAYEDGVLIRDCVCARRDSDGEIGMYDFAYGEFHGNTGTGTFIAGEVVTQPSNVVRKVTSGWINVDNVARRFFGGSRYYLKAVHPTNSYATTTAYIDSSGAYYLKLHVTNNTEIYFATRIFDSNTNEPAILPKGTVVKFTVRYKTTGLPLYINCRKAQDNSIINIVQTSNTTGTITQTYTATVDITNFQVMLQTWSSTGTIEAWVDSIEVNGEKVSYVV